MSVDETIRELSGTIAQLGNLVSKINEQIGGISSRINITLQTFDDSVSGIAKDANKMTEQVDSTIAQIPGNWAFYLLFFSLLAVLFLLSVLILINLVLKIQSICRQIRGQSSRSSTPLQPLVQAESKQPLHPEFVHPSREQPSLARQRHMAVEMESEPRRYGIGPSPGTVGFSGRTASTAPTIYHHPQQQTTIMSAMDLYGNGKGTSASSPSGFSSSELTRGRAFAAGASPRSQRGSTSNLLNGGGKQQKVPVPMPAKRTMMGL